ncbi:hypothetical protein HS7_14680 [Sulfolobales archaeon HS-7]|nr:hypothetical protein HS7_14680 [Sulfolobales archaeon HS-7]
MSMFSYMGRRGNKRAGTFGTMTGIAGVLLMSVGVYYALPLLITDTAEHNLKMLLGILFIGMGTFFIFSDYPSPKGSFITAALGVMAEGVEVNMFIISAYFMTNALIYAVLGGLLGFLSVLCLSFAVFYSIPEKYMRAVAIFILYTVGFVILTSGLV